MAKVKKKITYLFQNAMVNYYLIAMFTFFPIFLSNYYTHARTDKYWVFLILSIVLVIVVLGFFLSSCLGDNSKEEYRTLITDNFLKLSVPDIAFFAFFICALISTIFSSYPLDSLTGNLGRNNGLILIFVYLLVYLIITRFFMLKDFVFAIYLIVSSFVSGLAVVNCFYIDPFGIMEAYNDQPDVIADFASTIGNKNTLSSFICIFIPIAIMMFIISNKRYLRIISGISIVFGYTGLLAADSSSGFLGLFLILAVIAIVCLKNYKYFFRFNIALVILFASGKLLRLFSLIMSENHKDFEFIPEFLVFNPISYLFILVPLIIVLILYILKNKLSENFPSKTLRIILISLCGIALLYVLYLFIKYTFIDTESDIGNLSSIFRFNDKWGTHRGFMWKNGLAEFKNFNFFQMLFGSGPDTFYKVFEPYFPKLLTFGDSSTDCIHNEYLNYLITQGILGLASYLTLIISVIVRAYKKSKSNPTVLITAMSVICYSIQAIVNIYQPITTPLFIIFLSITEAFSRETYKENDIEI